MESNEIKKFDGFLQEGETILWQGKPEKRVNLNKSDYFLLPFGILITIISTIWELLIVRIKIFNQNETISGFLVIFGLPFILVGLYFIFGRFVYKRWRKNKVYYAVTNKRVFSLMERKRGQDILELDIKTINKIRKTTRHDGIGTINFGETLFQVSMYGNTGLDFGKFFTDTNPTFYDIDSVEYVYNLIKQQALD